MKEILIFCLVLWVVSVAPAVALAHEPLMVFAAASLENALREVAADFKKEYKADVNFNFGGSSALRVQIENGALGDIFFAADKVSVEKLAAKGLIEQKSVVNLLRNNLVVVSGQTDQEEFTSLYDMRFSQWDHLAIADPQTAPAGAYAVQALIKAGSYQECKAYIVPTLDVRAALALVQSGNAKYAIVYFSDVQKISRVKVLYHVPARLHEPIVYTAALIKDRVNVVSARNFLTFLQTEHSNIIFQKYGFQSF